MAKNKVKMIATILLIIMVINIFAPAFIYAATKTGTVTSDVNLRKGPGTNYAIVTTLKKGTKVTILDDSQHWYYVNTASGKGYMSSNYITVNKATGGSTNIVQNTTSSQSGGTIVGLVIEIIANIIKGIISIASSYIQNYSVTPGVVLNNTNMSLSANSLNMTVGETKTLKVSTDESNLPLKAWTSTNSSVATVENGKVVAKKAGITTIIATGKNGNTASCKVNVSEKNNKNGKTIKAQFTAYYPYNNSMEGGYYDCKGVLLDPSKNTCAAPYCIPYGTKIIVNGTGTSIDGKTYTVTDRGGDIVVKNDGTYRIDILMSTKSQCNNFGIRTGTITILN